MNLFELSRIYNSWYLILISELQLIFHTILHNFLQFSLQIRKTKTIIASVAIDTSNQKATEDRITRMIMTVVGIFIACNSFQFVYNAYQALRGPQYVMFVLSYFIGTLNSSVNSVVYGIFSKKYRKVFFEQFCRKKPIQAESQLSSDPTKNTDLLLKLMK